MKSVYQGIRIKQRFYGFIATERDESEAPRKIEELARKTFLIGSKIDDYKNGGNQANVSNKRIIAMIIVRLFLLTNGLRYLISGALPSKRMRGLLSDANYLLTNSQIFPICLSDGAFTVLFHLNYSSIPRYETLFQFMEILL